MLLSCDNNHRSIHLDVYRHAIGLLKRKIKQVVQICRRSVSVPLLQFLCITSGLLDDYLLFTQVIWQSKRVPNSLFDKCVVLCRVLFNAPPAPLFRSSFLTIQWGLLQPYFSTAHSNYFDHLKLFLSFT